MVNHKILGEKCVLVILLFVYCPSKSWQLEDLVESDNRKVNEPLQLSTFGVLATTNKMVSTSLEVHLVAHKLHYLYVLLVWSQMLVCFFFSFSFFVSWGLWVFWRWL